MSGLEDYCRSVRELMDAVKTICRKWEEYEGVLDAYILEGPSLAYHSHPSSSSRHGPGGPQFEISKEQLEYVSSLGFHWSEIFVLWELVE